MSAREWYVADCGDHFEVRSKLYWKTPSFWRTRESAERERDSLNREEETRMFAVMLTNRGIDGDATRFLDPAHVFRYSIDDAHIFKSTADALQAIHDRGLEARNKNWETGTGTLSIVEVESVPIIQPRFRVARKIA